MEEEFKPKISQLLEKLQEESWQLELLISGFAIFLVASSWTLITDLLLKVSVASLGLDSSGIIQIPAFILIAA